MSSMLPYSIAILSIGVANLALAAVAYLQRAKQIRGNALREHQLKLAETRNELAESRLRRLDDQLALLAEIRDALCGSATGRQIAGAKYAFGSNGRKGGSTSGRLSK